jgi:hypothetical protein
MQILVMSIAFGGVCTMILWVVSGAAARRNQWMRHGGRLFPPKEF